MQRKCIYTNKNAKSKDYIIPSDKAGKERDNWANKAPCSKEYRDKMGHRMPTDLEFEIHETFQLLELSRLKTKFLELKLEELQNKLNGIKPKQQPKKPPKPSKEQKKNEQIQQAYLEKEVSEITEASIDEILNQRKNIWEE